MLITYDTEEWRVAVGVRGYEVSSAGRVRSVDRSVFGADGRTRRFRGQVIQGSYDKRLGYYRVVLYVGGKAIGRTVHSLVAEAFIGPCPEGHEVRHKNGQHGDCRAINLEYGTRSENNHDQVRHDTHANASKSACRRKHLLVEPNLVPSVLPRRGCLACSRARTYVRQYPEHDLTIIANERYEEIMGAA